MVPSAGSKSQHSISPAIQSEFIRSSEQGLNQSSNIEGFFLLVFVGLLSFLGDETRREKSTFKTCSENIALSVNGSATRLTSNTRRSSLGLAVVSLLIKKGSREVLFGWGKGC